MERDLKICGIKTKEVLDTVLKNGASHVGFVFFKKSPRNIDFSTAASLRSNITKQTKVVAVTVNAEDIFLDKIIFQVKPDLIQMHGSETPCRVSEIRNRYKLPVMKAFPVRVKSDLQSIIPYQGIADHILFDTQASQDQVCPGGNGVPFDWMILNTLDGKIDYMLSGGINIYNVAHALTKTRAKGIDVSSGVESETGEKDVHLINAFFAKFSRILFNEINPPIRNKS